MTHDSPVFEYLLDNNIGDSREQRLITDFVEDNYIRRPKPQDKIIIRETTEREHKCLVVLAECYYDESEWSAVYMRGVVADTKLNLRDVRRAVRSLARKGLAVYERGLFSDDDGIVAGSGYRCTKEGKELIEAEIKKAEEKKAAAEAQTTMTI